jgi:hypothetical protein
MNRSMFSTLVCGTPTPELAVLTTEGAKQLLGGHLSLSDEPPDVLFVPGGIESLQDGIRAMNALTEGTRTQVVWALGTKEFASAKSAKKHPREIVCREAAGTSVHVLMRDEVEIAGLRIAGASLMRPTDTANECKVRDAILTAELIADSKWLRRVRARRPFFYGVPYVLLTADPPSEHLVMRHDTVEARFAVGSALRCGQTQAGKLHRYARRSVAGSFDLHVDGLGAYLPKQFARKIAAFNTSLVGDPVSVGCDSVENRPSFVHFSLSDGMFVHPMGNVFRAARERLPYVCSHVLSWLCGVIGVVNEMTNAHTWRYAIECLPTGALTDELPVVLGVFIETPGGEVVPSRLIERLQGAVVSCCHKFGVHTRQKLDVVPLESLELLTGSVQVLSDAAVDAVFEALNLKHKPEQRSQRRGSPPEVATLGGRPARPQHLSLHLKNAEVELA